MIQLPWTKMCPGMTLIELAASMSLSLIPGKKKGAD